MTRTSILRARDDPTRSISPDSRTRSSLACWRTGTFPISSRKIVPPSASSKRPMRSVRASVKAPFTCPKSSLSNRPSASAPVFTATSGREAREESACSVCATTSLPLPCSPVIKYVGVGGTDASNGLKHRLHGRGFGDELRPALRAKKPILRGQPFCLLEREVQFDLGAQNRQQALVLPGLLDEVPSAAPHGFDRQFDVAPSGHDDDGQAANRA